MFSFYDVFVLVKIFQGSRYGITQRRGERDVVRVEGGDMHHSSGPFLRVLLDKNNSRMLLKFLQQFCFDKMHNSTHIISLKNLHNFESVFVEIREALIAPFVQSAVGVCTA